MQQTCHAVLAPRCCYAYQDANYGYGGFYIDRDEYNYYFREGFRRLRGYSLDATLPIAISEPV